MLKAPKWCKDAVPTLKGWENPKTGEVYKKVKHTQEQIDEWKATEDKFDPIVPKAEMLTEAPANNKHLDDMTETERDVVESHAEEKPKKARKSQKKKGISSLFK